MLLSDFAVTAFRFRWRPIVIPLGLSVAAAFVMLWWRCKADIAAARDCVAERSTLIDTRAETERHVAKPA